jgi:cation diffusion facilitator family transporter
MKEKVALISVAANIFLAAAKVIAGAISGSAAVLADGFHSLADVFSSGIAFLGIKISAKPVDERHPYGYYKAEVLAGAAITLILFVTGAGIIYGAWGEIAAPKSIEMGGLALAAMAISAAVNEVMARLKIHFGKKENSVSLLADGIHSRVDIFSSLGVFAGLLLAGAFPWADPLLAIIIGLYIIKESFSLGREAVDSLLDASAGSKIEKNIREIVARENIEIAGLKTQKKGAAITADLDIVLPAQTSVDEAAKISDRLRKKLMSAIDNLNYVAVEIKSHGLETGFYKPEFGKGFGWQRQGRFKTDDGGQGRGPGGECVCPKCGRRAAHQSGVPCAAIKCPDCNANMERDQAINHQR